MTQVTLELTALHRATTALTEKPRPSAQRADDLVDVHDGLHEALAGPPRGAQALQGHGREALASAPVPVASAIASQAPSRFSVKSNQSPPTS